MTTPTDSAEKAVAEWRDAMEGVPDGEIERAFIVDGYGEAIQGEAVLYLPDDNEAEFRGAHAEVISAWFERCSPSGISGLLDRLTAAEARVTALDAEKAGWQDIASAPKDGTKFDAWVPDAFGGRRMTNLSFGPRGNLRQNGSLTSADLPRWPTHWRPLPEPPQALSRSSTEVKNDEAQ